MTAFVVGFIAVVLALGFGWHRTAVKADNAVRLADHLGRELDARNAAQRDLARRDAAEANDRAADMAQRAEFARAEREWGGRSWQ